MVLDVYLEVLHSLYLFNIISAKMLTSWWRLDIRTKALQTCRYATACSFCTLISQGKTCLELKKFALVPVCPLHCGSWYLYFLIGLYPHLGRPGRKRASTEPEKRQLEEQEEIQNFLFTLFCYRYADLMIFPSMQRSRIADRIHTILAGDTLP